MKFISWSIDGLRGAVKDGFLDYLKSCGAETVCLQEIRMKEDEADFDFGDYNAYWNCAERPGYAGTLTLTKEQPLSIKKEFADDPVSNEGRVLTTETENYYLVNTYMPDVHHDLSNLSVRLEWNDAFRNYLVELKKNKSVIVCGNFNVAHYPIDLAEPEKNEKHAGFLPEERKKLTELLSAGFIDTYRYLHPKTAGEYTWWSARRDGRDRNIGWRIDYFLVSDNLASDIESADICNNVTGRDHCPISLTLK